MKNFFAAGSGIILIFAVFITVAFVGFTVIEDGEAGVKADFGKTGAKDWIKADIHKDGKVDVFDYNVLVGAFGT